MLKFELDNFMREISDEELGSNKNLQKKLSSLKKQIHFLERMIKKKRNVKREKR